MPARACVHSAHSKQPLSNNQRLLQKTNNTETVHSPKQATMSPTLVTIPPELVGSIAEQLDYPDVLKLRLVRKQLLAAVNHHFVLKFPTERTLLFTEYALQTLAHISAQPQFSRKLEHLTLITALKSDESMLPVDHEMNSWSDIVSNEESEAELAGDEHLQWLILARRKYFRESRQLSNDEAVPLLAEILRNLAEHAPKTGLKTGLSVVNEPYRYSNIFGMAREFSSCSPMLKPDYIWHGCGCPEYTIKALLQAIATSQAIPTCLYLCSNDHQGVDVGALQTPATLWPSLQKQWQGLTSLGLGLKCDHKFMVALSTAESDIGQMLGSLVSLVHLRLLDTENHHTADCDYGRNLFRQVASALPARRLRNLALRGMYGDQEDFLDILTKNATTLESVYIDGCSVLHSQTWDAVVVHMQRGMQLEKLVIKYLWTHNELGDIISCLERSDGGSVFWMDGTEEIAKGLQQLAPGQGRYV